MKMNTNDIRRINLRRLAARSSWTTLAKQLGYKQPSFLVQMAGPNPTRDVTEKSVRAYEQDLGLPDRSLDTLPVDLQTSEMIATQAIETTTSAIVMPQRPAVQVNASSSSDPSSKIVRDVISLVDANIALEHVQLDPVKYANLVHLALSDALEHGGQARQSHIQLMMKLTK